MFLKIIDSMNYNEGKKLYYYLYDKEMMDKK